MRLTAVFTVIGAFTALSSAASNSNGNGEHLALLTRKQRSLENNVHGDAMRSKRQHGNPASGLKKKTKRASGYCKAKTSTSSGSSSSKANAVVTPASSSKQSTPTSSAQQQKESSSSSSKVASSAAPAASSDSGSSGSGTANAQLGSISAFQGTNSGIMSWFKTNLGSDSTNGESWCQTKYQVRAHIASFFARLPFFHHARSRVPDPSRVGRKRGQDTLSDHVTNSGLLLFIPSILQCHYYMSFIPLHLHIQLLATFRCLALFPSKQDDWMCFAPSVGTMLNNFGGDYSAATKAYCGREVKVT